MARIRTVKPEFWESESIGRLSMGARLLCIAALNMADDEGLLRWNEAYLMSQAFVYDELNIEQVTEWMGELVTEGIVFPYKAGSTNQRLGWIVNFRKHQVINRPQPSKLPPPSIQSVGFKKAINDRDGNECHICRKAVDHCCAVNEVGSLAPSLDHLIPVSNGGSDYPSNLKTSHVSCNKSRGNKPLAGSGNDSLNDSINDSLTEGKGEEGKGEDLKALVPSVAGDHCPHQKIIALYHEVLPQCPRVRDWTPARATQLRARWNEDEKRQNLDYWRQFFEYVKTCDFLVGKAGKEPFFADLEWITKSANFTKIREAKYENRRAT